MSMYLDSADLDDVRRARDVGVVAGVTTNPALIAQTGRPGLAVLADILGLIDGDVFYQVTADTVSGRLDQALAATDVSASRVVIKVPATSDNLAMTARLAAHGARCAVTAVSHASQAYLAAQASAEFAIPYVNRLTRQLGDGVMVLREIAAVLDGSDTRVLAASLKTPDEVVAALLNGADDVTIPPAVLESMGNHDLSEKAIADFAAALDVGSRAAAGGGAAGDGEAGDGEAGGGAAGDGEAGDGAAGDETKGDSGPAETE